MQIFDLGMQLREAMFLALKLGAPPLLGILAAGFLMSLIQTVTQINEATLAFVPKVLALAAVLMLMGGFMTTALTDYGRHIFDQVVVAGAS